MRARAKIKLGDPVYVEWIDASHSPGGWLDKNEIKAHIKGTQVIRSLGFLIRNDKEHVSLIHNTTKGSGMFVTNIPTPMVKKIQRAL